MTEDLFALGFDTLRGTVERALKKIEARDDPDQAAVGVAAQGIALAASLMSREFTLVATNVPYLGSGDLPKGIRDWCQEHYFDSKADLATVFIDRCLSLLNAAGALAVVSTQGWWFMGCFSAFRRRIISEKRICFVASLGEESWQSFGQRGPKATLTIIKNSGPFLADTTCCLDASGPKTIAGKMDALRTFKLLCINQSDFKLEPDQRISVRPQSGLSHVQLPLLSSYAYSYKGLSTGDLFRFVRLFWELSAIQGGWVKYQGSASQNCTYGGRHQVLFWEEGRGVLVDNPGAFVKGTKAWGHKGINIMQMRYIPVTLYTGEIFDENAATIVPKGERDLLPIFCFCTSDEYVLAVRRIDNSVKITNRTLVKVQFDMDYWQTIAKERFPNGLPEPQSDDPTQWLFKGHPKASTDPLQVAVARLLGYRWPEQEPDDLEPHLCGTAGGGWATSMLIDAAGIVPIPAVRGEPPAAERLREVLKIAFASEWSASLEHKLLAEAGTSSGTGLDDWLRNSFFEQHFKRFHQRPFIWHLWDGRKDGFSCLVNYHKLTHKLLDNLTYSYVQDWINLQAADARSGKIGADLRLAAAQVLQEKLKLILAGEPPYDIFVRWKPISEQPIGWNPDLNDGVRMNIRPFVQAGILRKNLNIKWTKDRGKEPERPKAEYSWFWVGDRFTGDRVNDVHLTNAQKQDARKVQALVVHGRNTN